MIVRIYTPTKSTMQSGHGKTGSWVLEYESTSGKKPEPLMGWTSAQDTLGQIKLSFDTQEAAVAFAVKNGWQYTITKSKQRLVKPRNYGDNFRYIPPKETATK